MESFIWLLIRVDRCKIVSYTTDLNIVTIRNAHELLRLGYSGPLW